MDFNVTFEHSQHDKKENGLQIVGEIVVDDQIFFIKLKKM